MASEQERRLREEAAGIARATTDLEDVIKKVNESVSKVYFGSNAQKGKELVSSIRGEYQKLYDEARDNADSLAKPYQKFANFANTFPLSLIFDNPALDSAVKSYKDKIEEINIKRRTGAITEAESERQSAIAGRTLRQESFKSLLKLRAAAAGLGGVLLSLGKKFIDTIKAVDNATASLIQTSGILDGTFSKTLIEATEQASLLGGNVQLAADYASDFLDNISPSIPLTGKLVGNLAQVGEKLQIGSNTATKLTQIISELNNVGFETASGLIDSTISSLRLGPRIARDLAQSYEEVTSNFNIGLNSLIEQTKQANELGVSIGEVSDFAQKLLDLQSSISAEFRASAIIGQQINLQKARQLAFEGDIVGALNSTLDQVEAIGGVERLNFFQRSAIAEATGLTVSELRKELNIRRQLGTQAKLDAASRESALGKIELITRRLQGAFFRILASDSVQNGFEVLADALEQLITGGAFQTLVDKLSNAVDVIGQLIEGSANVVAGFDLSERRFTLGVDRPTTNQDPSTYQLINAIQENNRLLKQNQQNGLVVQMDSKQVGKVISTSQTYNN